MYVYTCVLNLRDLQAVNHGVPAHVIENFDQEHRKFFAR